VTVADSAPPATIPLDTDITLFLPIAESTLRDLLDASSEPANALRASSCPEIAAHGDEHLRVQGHAGTGKSALMDTYTHVVIDESHDLPAVVRQILAASPQALATLGDDSQNLRGFVTQPSPLVRHREMTHSVRTG